MQLVRGKSLSPADPADFAARVEKAEQVIVDVGTGDARTAYRMARAQPEWLVVGLDPAWQRMCETGSRSIRKPERGGAANLVLVNASIETAPAELHGVADEVLVLMPWGRLLHGLVNGDADVCTGLRSVAATGAALDVTIGTSIWRDPVPREIAGLPELTASHVENHLAPRLSELGWLGLTLSYVSPAELASVRSSWARRLTSSPGELIARLRATAG